jgi:hypothetical protein
LCCFSLSLNVGWQGLSSPAYAPPMQTYQTVQTLDTVSDADPGNAALRAPLRKLLSLTLLFVLSPSSGVQARVLSRGPSLPSVPWWACSTSSCGCCCWRSWASLWLCWCGTV